jgi:hypothetical protein
MTTDELRRELDRIAGSAPAIELPGDTWRRARRSVVRDRAAMVVAGAAVVVGVAGVVAWLPDDADPPVAAGPAGVPARIQNAPTYFTGQDLDDLTYSGDIETALDIGRAAVAYATEEGVPVVVDAASGEYHFLALPGFAGIFAAMELSPDGQHLAYSYADPAAQERNSDPMPTGVRIVDLETGDLRDVPLQGGMGVSVHDVSWSPGGTWLIWAGSRTTDWDSGGVGSSGGSLLGVVAPGAAVSQLVDPVDRQYMAAAVSDEGEP